MICNTEGAASLPGNQEETPPLSAPSAVAPADGNTAGEGGVENLACRASSGENVLSPGDAAGEGGTDEKPASPGDGLVLDEPHRREALEAMLFATGYPLSYDKIAPLLGMTRDVARDFVRSFAQEYNAAQGRGLLLIAGEGDCRLCTKGEYAPLIRAAMGGRGSGKLSPSALEVLAIVAYHQPVTRATVDEIRGVDSSYALGVLVDRGLVSPTGRVDAPGRPLLYGTTDDFLLAFGLTSLKDLPDYPPRADPPDAAQLTLGEGDVPAE